MDLEQVRHEVVDLLKEDKYRFTDAALAGARASGYTELEAVDLILDRLTAGFPIREIQMGEPPGSGGVGYTMTRADGKNLYIKFLLEWSRVKILSFKESKHSRGG